MLTIELDSETEHALQELAQQQGKTSEQWLKEVIDQFVQAQTRRQEFPDLTEFHKTLPMQEVSAGEFCRAMRDDEEANDPHTERTINTSLLMPESFFASLPEIDTENPPPLTDLFGKVPPCFKSAAEVDTFIRAERDAWDD